MLGYVIYFIYILFHFYIILEPFLSWTAVTSYMTDLQYCHNYWLRIHYRSTIYDYAFTFTNIVPVSNNTYTLRDYNMFKVPLYLRLLLLSFYKSEFIHNDN